jgi:hypothetical protein
MGLTCRRRKNLNTNDMAQFNFETLKETEKAIFAKVPYFEATSDGVKKHKQLFFECWIPKVIIEKGIARDFVIAKRNEKRLSNAYQRLCEMPNSWKTLGEYAPVKSAQKIEVIDYDKLKELIVFYETKYGANLRRLVIDLEGSNGYVSDEDEEIINQLEFPSLTKVHIPKKQITIYK